MKKEFLEEISEMIEQKDADQKSVLFKFFDMLFWRDYSCGYVAYNHITRILQLMDSAKKCGPEGESYIKGDEDKMFELANIIREQINLPKLSFINGILKEEK